jgi:hypothetical protein
VTAILEKHLHYINQYADALETKINQLEFATQKRMQLLVMQNLTKMFGRLAIAIITIAAICKLFRYKVTLLVIHGFLHAFVNKTLNTAVDEREERRHTLGLTKQQGEMYAME